MEEKQLKKSQEKITVIKSENQQKAEFLIERFKNQHRIDPEQGKQHSVT